MYWLWILLVSNVNAAEDQVHETGEPLSSSPEKAHRGRELGGHLFLPSALVSSPFVTTRFGVAVGAGITTLDLTVGDEESTLGLEALEQDFDFDLALGPFLGVRGALGGFVVAPTDSDTAIDYGADIEYTYNLGVVVRAWRPTKSSQVALSSSVHHEQGKAIRPRSGLNEAETIIIDALNDTITEI